MKPLTVNFVNFGGHIASSRLRAEIPQRELAKLGIQKGDGVVVYGKHFVNNMPPCLKVYDVCDDHYHTPDLRNTYIKNTLEASAVTCNSETMREIILRETGRNATVIPDPYESEERPADMGYGLLWYGHDSNYKTIKPYLSLGVTVLTGSAWSRERQLDLLDSCSVVLIPTDERKAKSANRMIEAIRNGRFVVAGELPAHDEFKDFMWIGDIEEGVTWALQHREEAIARVKAAQDYIREKYAPSTIAKQWLDVLEGLWITRR